MQKIKETHNKILEIDLHDRSINILEIGATVRKRFLGGKGLGLKLLYDRLSPGIDPLGPENIIALMPGILMGTGAPCSGRFMAVFKSPLTGIISTASCGGPFGMALKTAGWDGLVISGCADVPIYILITDDGAAFKDAGQLWGCEIPEVQSVLDERKAGSVVIGPAGENRVLFANAVSGHRFLGRGGLGAVMGSKNLKAVVARGGVYKLRPVDRDGFQKTKSLATRYLNQNTITADRYRNFGTCANVRPCLDARILPVHNFQDGWHAQGDRLSGEAMAANHQTKHHTCKPCTILCGHRGIFKGARLPVPEYETVGILGASLGIFDPDLIAQWNDSCNRLGLDTISTGGTLAWTMEAAAQGLITSKLCFGSQRGIDQAIQDIAYQQDFGAEMASGTRYLATKYGGQDFAMQVKGLELAAYDPRGSFGQGLAYAVANRGGCHLSAYMIAQEVFFDLLKPYSTRSKAKWVKFLEDLNCCINALKTCQFTMYAYVLESPLPKHIPKPLLRWLMHYLPGAAIFLVDFSIFRDFWNTVTGFRLTNRDFITAGERIHILERYMNTREGITRKDDNLPARLLNTGRASDPQKQTVPLENMLAEYYRLRGYDENGIPTMATLQRLELLE